MRKCSLCGCQALDPYPIDRYIVCERCFAQGRLDEIPEVATADHAELVGAATTVSSWWNRDVPPELQAHGRS
jgi:hypothetical protein